MIYVDVIAPVHWFKRLVAFGCIVILEWALVGVATTDFHMPGISQLTADCSNSYSYQLPLSNYIILMAIL